MKKNIFDEIYEEYKKQLNNLFEPNKKLVICFAGIPGSGKTYLAKKLERRYRGVRINNDDLRKIIDSKIGEDKREEILQEFLLDLLKTFSFENKLVILDSGIERKYEDVKNILEVEG